MGCVDATRVPPADPTWKRCHVFALLTSGGYDDDHSQSLTMAYPRNPSEGISMTTPRENRPTFVLTRAIGLMIALAGFAAGSPSTAAQVACAPATPGAVASPAATPPSVPSVAFPGGNATLTVFAAASLTDVFADLESRLEADHEGLDVIVETGGSQGLVTQLQEGATVDVLATANMTTMTTAAESGLIAGTPVPFTANHLVIVAPADNPAGITSLDDLAGDDVRLVIANEEVPAGTYTRQALCSWSNSDAVPAGGLDAVAGNVVSEEEDVRNVLAKVQLGEADAGIVYASDAVASELAGTPLTVVDFPAGVPVSASYPVAATAGGDQELANAFIGELLSLDGQALLERYGFTPIGR